MMPILQTEARRRELDYGLSTFGKSLPWAAAETFSLYFLTEVASIPAVMAGAFVLSFFLWNAICDPLVGWLLDRWSDEKALTKRYFVAGTLLSSALFVLSFSYFRGSASAAILLIAGLAFRAAYASVDVPHNALLTRLGDVSQPRLGLSAARQVAGLAATLLVTLAARPLLEARAIPAGLYVAYASGVAAVGALLFLGFLPIPDRAERPPTIALAAPASAPLGTAILAAIAAIVAMAMAGALVAGAFSKDVVYIAKYVFHDAAWTVEALMALMVGRSLAVPLWWLAPRYTGLPAAIALSWAVVGAAGAILSSLPPDKLLFASGLIMVGVGLGGVNALSWAVIPQLAHELGHRRSSGVDIRVFGIFTAMTKVASGLSGVVLGLLLAETGVGSEASETVGQGHHFYLMACLIPVPCAALGFLCLGAFLASTDQLSWMGRRRRSRRNRPTPRR